MKKRLFSFPKALPARIQNSVWVLLGYMLVNIALLVLIFRQAALAPSWQLWVTGALAGAAFGFALLGLVAIFNNHPERGVWITFIPWGFVLVITSSVVTGLGLSFLLAALTMFILVANLTLPEQQRSWFINIGALLGLLSLLADVFIPTERISIPGLQLIIYGSLAFFSLILLGTIVTRFWDYPLRTKLMVTFLTVTLLPLGGTFALNNWVTQRNLVAAAETSLQGAAVETAAALDTFLESGLSDVRIAARFFDLIEYMELPASERAGSEAEEHMYSNIRSLVGRNETYISSIGLMDLNGQNLADTDPSQIGEIEADKPFFTETLAALAPTVSDVELDEGDLSLYFSAPILSQKNEVIGVLRIRYDAAILQAILAESAANSGVPDGVADLIDENQIFLGLTDDPEDILHTVVTLPEELFTQLQADGRLPETDSAEELSMNQPDLEALLNNAAQDPHFVLESESEQASVAFLRNKPWKVLFAQPQATYLTPLVAQNKTATISGVLIAMLAVFASFGVVRFISQPVLELTRVAQDVADGNLNQQVTLNTKDEFGTLSRVFNSMTAQIRDSIDMLEQRVAERTKALATSNEVSRRLSTILDEKQLVREVVEQVREAFDYYHSHIYLYDSTGSELIMAGGTGEVGRVLLAQGHKIPRGKGLVGRAAELNLPVLVSDTSQDPNWLPNTLLPDTKSEVAVPISIGNQVLGVLDVQHNIVGGLKLEDADLLQSIANQVAIAIQNARSYARAQKQAQYETLVGTINQNIQKTTSVETAMQVAIREVGRALGGTRVQVTLREGIDANLTGSKDR